MRSSEPLPPAGGPPPFGLAEAERLQREACTRLREIEHWRRLVDARLDLAVAALTTPDHPTDHPAAVLALPAGEAALAEVALLPRLREARRELDSQARVLRLASEAASRTLAHLVLAQRRPPDGDRDTLATVTLLRP